MIWGKKKAYMAKGKIHYQLFLRHQKHTTYSRSLSGNQAHRFLSNALDTAAVSVDPYILKLAGILEKHPCLHNKATLQFALMSRIIPAG